MAPPLLQASFGNLDPLAGKPSIGQDPPTYKASIGVLIPFESTFFKPNYGPFEANLFEEL